MKFIITVYKENHEVAPCGFGVLENSGNDLEESAKGDLTIGGYTVNASLALSMPAPDTNEADAADLAILMDLYKED